MSYAGIYVGGKEVFTYRDGFHPEVCYLFTKDELLHLKGREAVPYAYGWQREAREEHPEEIEVHAYQAPASVLRERLKVLGFDVLLVRRVVEALVRQEISIHTRSIANLRAQHDDAEDVAAEIQEQIESLQAFDYDEWASMIREHIELKQAAPEPDWRNMGPLYLFEDQDERVLLRAIVDHVGDDEPIVLDVTDFFEYSHIEADRQIDSDLESSWDLGSSPPIVITEGSYDAHVLRGALELLKPHLVPYIRFLDYDAGNEGGAAATVRMLKSFAAAGVSNRIVAIFDNDSAAYEAVMQVRGSSLPSHYVVMHYPDLELASAYPTLGPQGRTEMNVNRLAGSIELYLGRDVLTSLDSTLTPVQWKGYMSKVGAYQGEIINKGAVQRAFNDKLRAAKADPFLVPSQDWSGLEAILDALVNTLSTLSSIGRDGWMRKISVL